MAQPSGDPGWRVSPPARVGRTDASAGALAQAPASLLVGLGRRHRHEHGDIAASHQQQRRLACRQIGQCAFQRRHAADPGATDRQDHIPGLQAGIGRPLALETGDADALARLQPELLAVIGIEVP